ncbi:hypothetical protein WJX72_003565 [[Myrmecia] bisecta]|uniref:PEST proteolytic signal-containing nuclear protein n=1 Tax=[Myrmecia] bisecta TaxID=41462 RepID=A0AAW1PEL7_9CHLO
MSFTDSDTEFSPERSKDSLAVHKARLQRGKQHQNEHEDREDEELADTPESELDVQTRIDSISLAQKRIKATGKPSALSHSSSSDSEPAPAKNKIKAARTRFAADPKTPPEEEEKKSKLGGAMSSMGRKIAGVFGGKKKEEHHTAPAPVEISAESTHVKFQDGIEVLPPAPAEAVQVHAN